ncbi:MAG: hypothetical protein WD024_04230 [Bacillota bacterium]
MAETAGAKPREPTSPLFFVVLGGLLLLRFPLLVTAGLVRRLGPWVETVFDSGTFALTTLGLWTVRDRLGHYNMGSETVALAMLTPFLYVASAASSGRVSKGFPYPWFQMCVSTCLLAALLIAR